jgi:TolB-like protein/DNA-binding winged helix-turn-helix (wHTH) protein/Flp pilus assembly protein TadD
MQTPAVSFYEFGQFQLDTAKRLLRRKDGAPVPLTPRVFDTLLYMVEHNDGVLDKERIMEAVWPDSIVEENNLAQAIWKLRQIFGETPGSHNYIVTVPGRGYRFVASVTKRPGEPEQAEIPKPAMPIALDAAGPPGLPASDEPTIDQDQKPRTLVWRCLALVAAVLVPGLLALLFFQNRAHRTSTADTSAHATQKMSAQVSDKSIAVLPFENRSPDPDNAYFADSIQDEILTRLSKIADLKVISRTSTEHYKTAPPSVSEIAKELGVAHVVEGSVQKAGDAVRINVQLIKAASDTHIWADTFDRKLTDIFFVESEVAKAIADQVGARLTGREQKIMADKPTENPAAYDAYLRGLSYSLKTANTNTNVLGAQKYFREAVRLDPKFALSWALLSFVESRGYGTVTLQPTPALREEAREAAETAVTLQPHLGEAVLAKGFYHYSCLKDYDTALRYFEQARELLPNSSRIPESLAYVTRRQGKWDRSETYFNEAERLDPRNVSLLTQHALSYKDCRRFPEAQRKLEQILDIAPDDLDTVIEQGAVAQAEGDLTRAAALLAPLQPAADDTNALETQAYQVILERRPGPITSRLKELLIRPDPSLGFYVGELRFWLGWTQAIAGDRGAAIESWQQARSELESFLTEQPDNHILLGDLALTAISLGDKDAALAYAERAMTALPLEKDAVRGPATLEFLARVAAQGEEPERAIAALQKLLSVSYAGALGPGAPLTPALLRLDPMFDPLRNDPRFQKLAGSQERKEN